METITKTKIEIGSVAAIAILSLILSLGGAPDAGNWYFGIDNESNIICNPIQCDKLSAQNDLGISSRCYFFSEDLNRTTYKNCKTGWIKFEQPTQVEEIKISKDHVYLLCLRKNNLVSECQVVNSNETVIKLENS